MKRDFALEAQIITAEATWRFNKARVTERRQEDRTSERMSVTYEIASKLTK